MDTEGYLFFPVENLIIQNLYDWSVVITDSPVDNHPIVSCLDAHNHRLNGYPMHRTGTLVTVNEEQVALFRFGSIVYAIAERCPHAGGPLHIGDIEILPDQSKCVKCPYHGWKFNLITGQCVNPISRHDLSTVVFPVRVDHSTGTIRVGFRSFSSKYFTNALF